MSTGYQVQPLKVLLYIQLGIPIGIPLRGIARNGCFRLRHFIARNCAKIAKKEAIEYSRNCVQLTVYAADTRMEISL